MARKSSKILGSSCVAWCARTKAAIRAEVLTCWGSMGCLPDNDGKRPKAVTVATFNCITDLSLCQTTLICFCVIVVIVVTAVIVVTVVIVDHARECSVCRYVSRPRHHLFSQQSGPHLRHGPERSQPTDTLVVAGNCSTCLANCCSSG